MSKGNEILIKFGRRVKDLRLEKGIASQIDLASKTNLDRTYIGGIERGERNIGLINVAKIAKALGVNISDLFKF